MTQERRNKLVLLLTLAVYLCTRYNHSLYEMAFPNSWGLACINACYLRLGSSVECVPAFLCCYRMNHVASAAVAVSAAVPSGTLFLLIVRHYFSLLLFFSEVLQHTQYNGSAQAAVAEATQRVLSGSSDWEGERAMRRKKAASSDQAGVKVYLWQLTAKVKRALLRLSRQCRLNQHLLKTPQPPAVTQRALLSLIAILNCSTNDNRWFVGGVQFVTAALKNLIINKKCEAVIQCGCFQKLTRLTSGM